MKKVTLEHPKLKNNDPVTVPESTANELKKKGWKEAKKTTSSGSTSS